MFSKHWEQLNKNHFPPFFFFKFLLQYMEWSNYPETDYVFYVYLPYINFTIFHRPILKENL